MNAHHGHCKHERLSKHDGRSCADCGMPVQLTDPVIAAIVDTAPRDYTTQLRIAAVMGSAR